MRQQTNVCSGNHLTATAKVQKAEIVTTLAGDKGRKKVKGWTPRYMRFPTQPYTKRGSLPAAENWKAVRKLFDKTS